ncbi:MAG: CbiX/SirB N-terminal domain-containing protein, partial [Dehalococcoidia bacterium]
RAMGAFDAVRAAFWKEEPSFARALDGLEVDEVVAVPVFISSGYFTESVIPRELGLDGALTVRGGMRIRYTPPIGADAVLANVIAQRAVEAGAEAEDAIAVLGHGTPRNPNSERNVYLQAELLAATGRFAEVVTIFLEQEPHMSRVLELTAAERVIVVPLFIADGWHVGESIPSDLALDGPETRRDGRVLRYARAVGTHPAVADVILDLAGEGAAPARPAAIPAWVESAFAAGVPFAFGELAVRFERGAAMVEPPVAGREIDISRVPGMVRERPGGGYRPLTGEVGLPGGWSVRCETAPALFAALETVYPLAAVHAGQEADGGLRVVELEAVLARQSGRYGTVAAAGEGVRAAAVRATCGRCVRSPRWALPPGVPLEPAAGGIAIPCPEPCGILIENIRARTTGDGEG